VGGSPHLITFFLLSEKKVTQENGTPLPRNPSVLAPHLGNGSGARAFSTQSALAALHLPLKPKARQGGGLTSTFIHA